MLLAWRLACRASGCPVRWVNPHDMGTDDRPLDCGSEVWWHVGEWTVSCLSGMSIGPPAGKGKDIQEAWRAPPALLP